MPSVEELQFFHHTWKKKGLERVGRWKFRVGEGVYRRKRQYSHVLAWLFQGSSGRVCAPETSISDYDRITQITCS